MGQSNALRLNDVRSVFRLLGDCRDLGNDMNAWYQRAVEGLLELTNSVMVAGGIIGPFGTNEPVRRTHVFDVGWPTDRDRRQWLSIHESGRFLNYPTVAGVHRLKNRFVFRSRRQLIRDRDWYRSDEYADRAWLGQDDTLISLHWFGKPLSHQIFSVNRAVGDPPIPARQRKMVKLFHEELIRLYDGPVLLNVEDPFVNLPARLRGVLEALRDGDSEKQIAIRLGISRHTVHDHVRALYRRFDVGSRTSLLNLYWKRGGK